MHVTGLYSVPLPIMISSLKLHWSLKKGQYTFCRLLLERLKRSHKELIMLKDKQWRRAKEDGLICQEEGEALYVQSLRKALDLRSRTGVSTISS